MTVAIPSATALPSAAAASQSGSARSMFRALTALGRQHRGDDPAVGREAANGMLSELFFAPLLEEMRRFPFGRDLATGGQTEEIFGQRLDQQVADAVAATSPGLTEQMLRYLGGQATRALQDNPTNTPQDARAEAARGAS
jgi:Rod binding domain-containing protein